MTSSRPARVAAVALLGCWLASSCSAARFDDSMNPRAVATAKKAFAVDAEMLADSVVPNSALAGMRGVAPALRIESDFRTQVHAIDAGANRLAGAAEGYDAVVLIALAAEQARDDAPGRIADRMVDLTKTGKQCTDFRSCRRLIQTQLDPDYFGRSGGIQMQPNGDPAEAGFGTIEITSAGALRTGTITPAQAPASQAPAPLIDLNAAPHGDGRLRLAMLLPVAGPEGEIARAAQAGARTAVADINAAGGVLGEPIELLDDDTGDGSAPAVEAAVDRIITGGVDAVLGGTTYAIDRIAVPRLTAAGILALSPSDTSRAMTILPDRGLYFRLAPPDDLEGQVLGTLVANDGYTQAAVVTSGSADDLDAANDVSAALSAAGGKVTATVAATGTDVTAAGRAADEVIASGAQAVVVVAPTALAAPVLQALIERGKGPSAFGVYGTSANMTKELVTAVGGK